MLIDWFTVGAQVVNFLILVWLLKRFLYKPILHAIDAREKRIAFALADADAKQAAAEQERDTFREKNEALDQQRAALLGQARDAANIERQRLLDEARQAADALRANRQDALEREQQVLNDDIVRRTREEVFAIARKTLVDLAGTSLEARMSEVFERHLRALAGPLKDDLAKTLKTASAPALVRSAFELPSEQRAAIQKALNETFSAEIPVRFETTPEVIGGIELIADGRKVAWSIADYLVSLQKKVGDWLSERSGPEAKPGAKTELQPKSGNEPDAPEEAQ